MAEYVPSAELSTHLSDVPSGYCAGVVAVFVIVQTGSCGWGLAITMSVQPEVVVRKPSTGTSVTVYVPAGTTPSLTPSASNPIVRPPIRKLKSLGGLDDPTTTFRTWRRSSGTSSAVFVMVQTGIVDCGDETTTPVHPEVVVVKPATGGSVTVYVPAGSVSSLTPSASKLVVCPATVKLNSVGGRSEPTTIFRTWSFSDAGGGPSARYWKLSPSPQPPALASMR